MKPETGNLKPELEEHGQDARATSKPWWQSKTIIGIAAMLLSQVLKKWNVPILPAEVGEILTMALDFGGASLAVYGRVKARGELRLTKPGGAFNPHAEVRRAERVSHEGTKTRRGGMDKGSADVDWLPIVVVICVTVVTIFSLVFGTGCSHMASSVEAPMPVFDKAGKIRVENEEGYGSKIATPWRSLTYKEAKAAGFNFWQRNAKQPMLFPILLIDGLQQFTGDGFLPSSDGSYFNLPDWHEALRQLREIEKEAAGGESATPSPTPVPDIISEQPELSTHGSRDGGTRATWGDHGQDARATGRLDVPPLLMLPVEDRGHFALRVLKSLRPSAETAFHFESEDGIGLADVTPEVTCLWIKGGADY